MNTSNSGLACIETARSESNQYEIAGERLIPATHCQHPPLINASDLLLVDFDRRSVKYGALYLFEEIGEGGVVWRGCRRFDRQPGKTLIDVSGQGEWRPFDDQSGRWRIVGEVRTIYKPSR